MSDAPTPPSGDTPTISHVEEADHPVYAAPPSGDTDRDALEPWCGCGADIELAAARAERDENGYALLGLQQRIEAIAADHERKFEAVATNPNAKGRVFLLTTHQAIAERLRASLAADTTDEAAT